MERLHSLYEGGEYDLIVLDTPPTNHALDFLDAPLRMADAVETSALQWMYKPSLAAGKFSVGLFNIGTTYVLKTISKFTGSELLTELREFLVAFSDMLEGFGTRARRVREVLMSDATTFLIVTSPDPSTVDEARYFRAQLEGQGLPFGGFIVNRVHRAYARREGLKREPADLAIELAARANVEVDAALEAFASELLENAREFQVLADLDAETLEGLHERTGGKLLVCQVPFFSRDIHSFAGLDRVREALFDRCCQAPDPL
jgi:anion-transporting  ArsA/GET3 family ATPase